MVLGFIDRLLQYEQNFSSQPWIDFTREHAEIPVIIISLYLVLVFEVPKYLNTPLDVKKFFTLWNLGLSIFSTIGAYKVVPTILMTFYRNGFTYTVCADPDDWHSYGPTGFWLGLFVYSKFPELLDTMFLVLRQKRVMFLHWFHHITVLLYCWHAYHNKIGAGLWFAGMNYSIHSIMYFYYFLMSVGYAKFVRPLAPLITTLQIVQMVGGMSVLCVVSYTHHYFGDEACYTDAANYRLGLLMYLSYFILFVVLFYEKYLSKTPKDTRQRPPCWDNAEKVDGTGFFHYNMNPLTRSRTSSRTGLPSNPTATPNPNTSTPTQATATSPDNPTSVPAFETKRTRRRTRNATPVVYEEPEAPIYTKETPRRSVRVRKRRTTMNN